MAGRRLDADEAALWARVMASVRPLEKGPPRPVDIGGQKAASPTKRANQRAPGVALDPVALELLRHAGLVPPVGIGPAKDKLATGGGKPALKAGDLANAGVTTQQGSAAATAAYANTNTLDASWDRQLARGVTVPDRTVDLHGHTLSSAHALLDTALDRAIRDGERVILLVTGKPRRPESERPHRRGAIRAAIGDWLAGSRYAGAIAAVRGAHPRHGGTGALYIVLRRPRRAQKS
ncbi:MAG: Smr/MutS family protein [Sphingomonas sp.]